MPSVDEMITRKEIPVVLDDGNIAAGLPEDTQRMLLPEGSSGRLLENLHFDPLDILGLPLVEDGAEKTPQGFSRHSAAADPTVFTWLRLNQGQKGHVLGVDVLEESVNLGRLLDVLRMHHA
jgi:hypothetical protein